MKVICIDNYMDLGNSTFSTYEGLTIGNVYEVFSDPGDSLYESTFFYYIMKDDGEYGHFDKHRFKPYYREDNLDKLGIS